MLIFFVMACATETFTPVGCEPLVQHCEGINIVDPTPIEIPEGCGAVDVSVLYEGEEEPRTVAVDLIDQTVTAYCFTTGRVTVTLAGSEVDAD